ncbi:GGDEF domain-containing protein [Vibrio sp. ZSDZ34]|uniref:diguanylate cyclase n=1 Tax=Vibrio gelatinilyticus TaxID=2893468 RepID=A0A9X1WAT1_9VIBR|nr:GGDEF domain-containing protein [Vibrio gelatinilyticus]MCJ2377163.1 GGDEF domain-containing protein [Vibrio gelatinilyticus]
MSLPLVSSNSSRLFLPLLLLAVTMALYSPIASFIEHNRGFSVNLPYFLFGSSLVLTHLFKQGRIAMVALAMIAAYTVIQTRLQTPLSTGTTLLELSILAFLLPVSCTLPFLFRDTKLFSRGVAAFIFILLIFASWSSLILTHFYTGGFDSFGQDLLYSVDTLSKLPVVLVLYCLAMTGIGGIFVLNYNRSIDVVIYSSVLLSSATFSFFHVPYISCMLFSLSGALMVIYLISTTYYMAFNDRLTNIPGRRALELDIKHMGRKFTIAMLDIDYFKKFNDTYGHETGDDVLKLVASRMQMLSGNAKIYRYGGEEFTILFKGKTTKECKRDLEELREEIQHYEMVLRDTSARPDKASDGAARRGISNKTKSVNVTISIGAADSRTTRDPEAVMKLADNALYKAKEQGRNRVVFSR